jgi:two-component system, sporulation sensor kinase E
MLCNIVLSYYSTKENLREDSETKMLATARQIAIEVDQAQTAKTYVEQLIDDKLHLASRAIANELSHDIGQVTNEQLVELSAKFGISHISLLVPGEKKTTIVKSSNLADLNVQTNDWYFGYGEYQNFLRPTIWLELAQEKTSELFWPAPFEASQISVREEQRSFFVDNKRNYIINAYMLNRDLKDYYRISKMDDIVQKSIKANSNILEVTGIHPQLFKHISALSPPLNNQEEREGYYRALQPISFGTYAYMDPSKDIENVQKAAQGEYVTYETELHGKHVMKSFIRISNDTPYVISIVMDYKVISSVLNEQLVNNIAISIVLLEMMVISSYLIAGRMIRPIQSILHKVNDVANGNFGARLKVKSKDELGLLSRRINMMARNLSIYTNQLQQTYEENRAMKEYLESFINQTSDAIHVVDLEGRVILANYAFQQLFGWQPDQVIGKQVNIIPESKLEEEEEVLRMLASGEHLMARETQRCTKDDRMIDVSVSTSAIYDDNGKCIAFASITRDVTESKKMEELLRRSEKLTTVGQLAAGVAHEIRNPLTTLRGFLQFQQQRNVLNLNHTDIMLSELDRINLIVSEFLILAKPQAVHFQKKDVRFILGDVISLLDSQANMVNIHFDTFFTQERCVIECEENHLKQVFINISKNAFEAMPSGGTIQLRIEIWNETYVRVQIIDQGHGIPAENIPMLGQPFYTDKETGTGLGLMVSQRIIHNHKGTLEITSVVNEGTTVTILLPVSPEGETEPSNGLIDI